MKKTILITLVALSLTAMTDAANSIPETLDELWADFPEKDEATPLEVEILKTWEENDVVLRLVRFNIGEFKGEILKLAGFYAVPKGDHDRNLPALVVCHGGGQRASVGGAKNWAMNGYAAFCPNNGAQPWEKRFTGLPNTDYGSFNPAVRKPDIRHGKGRLAPGPNTVDDVLSPRNEAMYLRMFAMRRAITFLASPAGTKALGYVPAPSAAFTALTISSIQSRVPLGWRAADDATNRSQFFEATQRW